MFGDHDQGKAGLRCRDVLAQGPYKVGFGPRCGVMPEGGDLVQLEVSLPCAGGTSEHGVLEAFWFNFVAGAG